LESILGVPLKGGGVRDNGNKGKLALLKQWPGERTKIVEGRPNIDDLVQIKSRGKGFSLGSPNSVSKENT